MQRRRKTRGLRDNKSSLGMSTTRVLGESFWNIKLQLRLVENLRAAFPLRINHLATTACMFTSTLPRPSFSPEGNVDVYVLSRAVLPIDGAGINIDNVGRRCAYDNVLHGCVDKGGEWVNKK